MAASSLARPRVGHGVGGGAALLRGTVTLYLSLLVVLPLTAVVWRSSRDGWGAFWAAATQPQAVAALRVTFAVALAVAAGNVVMGTVIAWVLVRDEFPGKRVVNALIDLPFALPTIVAGITMLALYGANSPVGVDVGYTRAGVVLALAFVTLPFVVRSVQPVLLTMEPDMEEAARCLGAGPVTSFRRIVLPTIAPALLAGAALAFARAVGEFGSVVILSGNIPYRTEVASVHVFSLVENDDVGSAAAVSVVLLATSVLVLAGLNLLQRRRTRHAD
ncbi:MAG TPA: sulfate ABC transporter permease subunit CysT [Actinomycetes bacterium]|nr:sulfate ABC transporter permease subunit CysT [Actinomycetes bacterium]